MKNSSQVFKGIFLVITITAAFLYLGLFILEKANLKSMQRLDDEFFGEKVHDSEWTHLRLSQIEGFSEIPDPYALARNLVDQRVEETVNFIEKVEHHKKWLEPSGVTVFDVSINFDKTTGLRRSSEKDAVYSSALLLTGCSFVFGQGLEDHHTLPWLLQKKLKNTEVYNLGERGGSIASVYNQFQSKDLGARLNNKRVDIAYFFYLFHMERIVCPYWCHYRDHRWYLDLPFYQLSSKGKPQYMGKHSDNKSVAFLLKEAISKLPFFKTSQPLFGQYHYSKEDVDLVLSLLAGLRDFTSAEGSTYIVIGSDVPKYMVPMIKELAPKYGVKAMDFSKINLLSIYPDMRIPYDGHPSPKYNQALTELFYSEYIKGN